MNKRYNTPKNRARLKSMGNGFNDFYSGDSGLSFGNADSGYSRPRKARRHKKRTSRAKHVKKPHYTISIRI